MSETLATLAGDVRDMFEQRTRSDQSQYYCRKDDAPQWVADMCHDAHGDMFPDDYKYRFIVDALDLLADGLDAGNVEADTYTSELTSWLASSDWRTVYVDEAISEYGPDATTTDALGRAQVNERQEVVFAVRASLNAQLEE